MVTTTSSGAAADLVQQGIVLPALHASLTPFSQAQGADGARRAGARDSHRHHPNCRQLSEQLRHVDALVERQRHSRAPDAGMYDGNLLIGTDGHPLARHRIEIWQCDMEGNYMHPRDSRSVNFDRAFQGFGHDVTDSDGNYVFRTIKPTIYPGRTPHIHVKVFDGNRELLTTQFYIKGHPNNARDGLFNRMSMDEANAVSMEFVEGASGLEATIDVVV